MKIFKKHRTGLALVAAFAGFVPAAVAQTTPEAPASIEALTGETASGASAPIAIEGFRSATFGSDEAAVRAAIETDFSVSGDALVESANTAERTRILTAEDVEVLDGGGAADVSYVFGYESDALSQVSVLWSAEGEDGSDTDQLVANADVLQSYFLQSGYDADSVVLNVAVPEGLLVFRGSDAEGRMTVLLLRGTLAAPAAGANGEAADPVLTPTSLLLAYLADPQNPDVFRVEPGQF